MDRRLLLASLALTSVSSNGSTSRLAPLLQIRGQGVVPNNVDQNRFDFSEIGFLGLPQTSITTATSWTPKSVFTGPLLFDVMKACGVSAGTLIFKTLDDYSAPIPWQDIVRFGVILAHSQNGIRLHPKRWGPLWTIYPRESHRDELTGPIAESRFIWQVNKIEVVR